MAGGRWVRCKICGRPFEAFKKAEKLCNDTCRAKARLAALARHRVKVLERTAKKTASELLEIAEWQAEIDGLLAADAKPFNNRLEAAIYLYFTEEMEQGAAQREARALAAFIADLIPIKVNGRV